MPQFLAPICNDQLIDVNGDPLVGGQIETYLAGSTTPAQTYTDDSGAVPQSNPIILNSLGYSPNPIWLTGGVSYKFVIKNAAGVIQRTVDDIAGVNDASVSQSEWVESGFVPTYINATSFSVPGDQTTVLQIGRRLRTTNTSGLVYSTISNSVFAAGITTVTLTNDSTTLDPGLSAVAYALLSPSPLSVPNLPGSKITGLITASGMTMNTARMLGRRTAAAGAIEELTADQSASFVASGGSLTGFRNRVINGGFAINQRQLTSVADDAYCLDRWYVLTETGNVTVARQADQENGTPFNIRLTQPDVGAKQVALAQIIESSNCKDLRGKVATLALRLRNSAGAAVNYAILGWTGTADAVTSDVVSAWGSSLTYVANVTELVKGTITPAAATWTDAPAISATVGATVNNLIVIVWSDVDMAQNATLDLGRVQLEGGAVATPFEFRSFTAEVALCQRYYAKTYALEVAPATVTNDGTLGNVLTSTGATYMTWRYPVQMRVNPVNVSLVYYNPATGATGTWRDSGALNPAVSTAFASDSGLVATCTGASANALIFGHAAASAEL